MFVLDARWGIKHKQQHKDERSVVKEVFLNDETMKINMSSQAQTLIDGKGAERVADGILNYYGYT